MGQRINKLHEDVFQNQKIDHISFQDDLPEKMDKQMYIRIYRKIWAAIRHDLWKAIQDEKKKNNQAVLS